MVPTLPSPTSRDACASSSLSLPAQTSSHLTSSSSSSSSSLSLPAQMSSHLTSSSSSSSSSLPAQTSSHLASSSSSSLSLPAQTSTQTSSHLTSSSSSLSFPAQTSSHPVVSIALSQLCDCKVGAHLHSHGPEPAVSCRPILCLVLDTEKHLNSAQLSLTVLILTLISRFLYSVIRS